MLKYIVQIAGLCICMIIILTGCSENSSEVFSNIPTNPGIGETEKSVLAIELEHDFDNDQVLLSLNGIVIHSSTITTDYTISAAWLSGPFEYPAGNHSVTLTLPLLGCTANHDFALSDTLTIRITYNRNTNKILFFEQKGLFTTRD